jgi:uncharacterized protein with PIN domain
MLGTLTRYLRFLGYDTLSANSLSEGNSREDSLLLEIAKTDDRIILTRDRELAHRGTARAVLIQSEDVMEQVKQLVEIGIIEKPLQVRMHRCSLCNSRLRPATRSEIEMASYAPKQKEELVFYWCPCCKKLYWMGSHGRNLDERLKNIGEK